MLTLMTFSPSKPAPPSRAYLRVIQKDSLQALLERVSRADWQDGKGTWNHPSLAGPPVLEFATYQKVPSARPRTDARQGTIDQDPEFISFLASLTGEGGATNEPETENIAEETAKPDQKVTTTPLIEYLKEKKANKAKEAALAKSGKHARQESKGKSAASNVDDSKRKSKAEKEKQKEKAKEKPKETIKILSKKAAVAEAAEAAKAVAKDLAVAEEASPSTPKDAEGAKKSRRAGIAAAARILQRDLGLSPGSAHRKARVDARKAEADAKASESKDGESAPSVAVEETAARDTSPVKEPATPTTPSTAKPQAQTAQTQGSSSGRSRNRGGRNRDSDKGKGAEAPAGESSKSAEPVQKPIILLKKKDDGVKSPTSETAATGPSKPAAAAGSKTGSGKAPAGKENAGASSTSQRKQEKSTNSASSASAGAGVPPHTTKAYIKYAGATPGSVTEPALRSALSTFGSVLTVELASGPSRPKGHAYAEFADADSLTRAVAGSPLKLAGVSTVHVLERREKPSQEGAGSKTSDDKAKGGRGAEKPSTSTGKAKDSKAAADAASAAAAAEEGGGSVTGAGEPAAADDADEAPGAAAAPSKSGHRRRPRHRRRGAGGASGTGDGAGGAEPTDGPESGNANVPSTAPAGGAS